MFDNQLEKLKKARFEICNDTLIITCDKYMLERFKQSKIEIQQKFNIAIFPKKDQIRVKGNEVKIETFCDVLNFAFDLNKQNCFTIDQFNELLSKDTNEDNIIKKRRSSTLLPQINNIIPKAGSTSILSSRKFSDLGEIPEPIELEENTRSNSFLYSPFPTPIAILGSEKDDHKAKPTEFIPQKASQGYLSNDDQLPPNDFYNTSKSQPTSPKRNQKQNQANDSYKNKKQNKFVYNNNKKIERRSTVPNCQEFSPKTKIDSNKSTVRQNYDQKNSQNTNSKYSYSQKNNKNSIYYQKNRSQTISFYTSNNIKQQKSDESSDSICTEPDTTNDTSFNYSPRSYSPPINPITSSICTNSDSTNVLLQDFQQDKDISSNVKYKIIGSKLIYVISENTMPTNSKKRSAQEILQKVYESLGFNSQASFNKIIFKC